MRFLLLFPGKVVSLFQGDSLIISRMVLQSQNYYGHIMAGRFKYSRMCKEVKLLLDKLFCRHPISWFL